MCRPFGQQLRRRVSVVLATSRNLLPAETAHCAALLIVGNRNSRFPRLFERAIPTGDSLLSVLTPIMRFMAKGGWVLREGGDGLDRNDARDLAQTLKGLANR
jgi:hypothetical protein